MSQTIRLPMYNTTLIQVTSISFSYYLSCIYYMFFTKVVSFIFTLYRNSHILSNLTWNIDKNRDKDNLESSSFQAGLIYFFDFLSLFGITVDKRITTPLGLLIVCPPYLFFCIYPCSLRCVYTTTYFLIFFTEGLIFP